jgi:hypothetical protein
MEQKEFRKEANNLNLKKKNFFSISLLLSLKEYLKPLIIARPLEYLNKIAIEFSPGWDIR